MVSRLTTLVLTTFVISLIGCSSSETKNSDDPSLDPGADPVAQTDPAPEGGGEVAAAAPAANPDAPPPEPGADPTAVGEPVANADTPPPDPSLDPAAGAKDPAALDPAAQAAATPQVDSPKDAALDPTPAPVTVAKESKPSKRQPSAAGNGQFVEYTVQPTDTLMKIAFETYGDLYMWKKIYEDNKSRIKNPNAVPKGTVLKIEQPTQLVKIDRNGDKYEIRRGDTLGKISSNLYGTKTKWKKLWKSNEQLIKNPNKIFAGFFIYYSMSPEERDSAEKMKNQPELKASPLVQEQLKKTAPIERAPASNNVASAPKGGVGPSPASPTKK